MFIRKGTLAPSLKGLFEWYKRFPIYLGVFVRVLKSQREQSGKEAFGKNKSWGKRVLVGKMIGKTNKRIYIIEKVLLKMMLGGK